MTAPLRLNPLPGTDLVLSEVSFGAGTAAGLMVRGGRADQERAVARAVELGINHFDTAALYGFGASEVHLGRALAVVGADVVVTTKVNVPREYLACGTAGRYIRRSVEESLVRLGRDRVDILRLHNATRLERNRPGGPPDPYADILPHFSVDDVAGDDGVAAVAAELAAAGKIGHFGLSGQDNDPAAVRALIGAGRIAVFNQPFHLLNPSAGFGRARGGRPVADAFTAEFRDYLDFDDVIDFAAARGVGVAVISPVAAGALTEAALRGEPAPTVSDRAARFPGPGQYARELELARRFEPVAAKFDMTITELAWRFCLSAPGVTTVVGGFSDLAQLEEAAAAARSGPLPDGILPELAAIWNPDGGARTGTAVGPHIHRC
ncbi:MAG TPA: aldo/keto reductase [Acidimicrobiia bacterium]|nr:aldo/keto reductase [Acidimicrobiia bacterium]